MKNFIINNHYTILAAVLLWTMTIVWVLFADHR